jgi:hypothetical protein
MKHAEKSLAIQFIRPQAIWTLSGDDLIWSDKNQIEPTEAEIKAGWVAYQANQKSEAEAKAQAKTAVQAKLAALGLTVEDLQALGL